MNSVGLRSPAGREDAAAGPAPEGERIERVDRASGLEDVVRPHLAFLRATAEKILGDPDAAEDAVQETRIAVWRTGALEHSRGWLVRAVVHRSLHARRSARRRSRRETEANRSIARSAEGDPESDLGARELLAELEEVLTELAPEFREVFLMRDVAGFDYRQISDASKVPIGTVRSRLSRARAQVRHAMRRRWGTEDASAR